MSSHIAYWLDATSDASDPRWIISLETDDEVSETLAVLPAGRTITDAGRAAETYRRPGLSIRIGEFRSLRAHASPAATIRRISDALDANCAAYWTHGTIDETTWQAEQLRLWAEARQAGVINGVLHDIIASSLTE